MIIWICVLSLVICGLYTNIADDVDSWNRDVENLK
jgi:hypothetical protein